MVWWWVGQRASRGATEASELVGLRRGVSTLKDLRSANEENETTQTHCRRLISKTCANKGDTDPPPFDDGWHRALYCDSALL